MLGCLKFQCRGRLPLLLVLLLLAAFVLVMLLLDCKACHSGCPMPHRVCLLQGCCTAPCSSSWWETSTPQFTSSLAVLVMGLVRSGVGVSSSSSDAESTAHPQQKGRQQRSSRLRMQAASRGMLLVSVKLCVAHRLSISGKPAQLSDRSTPVSSRKSFKMQQQASSRRNAVVQCKQQNQQQQQQLHLLLLLVRKQALQQQGSE